MKKRENLVLLAVTLALLWVAGYDEPKVAPAAGRADAMPMEPEARPECTAAIIGQQWPEKVTGPSGYPVVCTHIGLTYAWRPLAARAEQRRKVEKHVQTEASLASAVPKE
jgi:hypothetical protein